MTPAPSVGLQFSFSWEMCGQSWIFFSRPVHATSSITNLETRPNLELEVGVPLENPSCLERNVKMYHQTLFYRPTDNISVIFIPAIVTNLKYRYQTDLYSYRTYRASPSRRIYNINISCGGGPASQTYQT